MVWIPVLMLVAAPPDVAVVVSRARPGAERMAEQVAERLLKRLQIRGRTAAIHPVAEAARCSDNFECLRVAAQTLRAPALVVVDVGRAGEVAALHLEAFLGDESVPFSTLTTVVPMSGSRIDQAMEELVQSLDSRLPAAAVSRPAPKVSLSADLGPAPDASMRVGTPIPFAPLAQSRAMKPGWVAPIILAGGAIAAGGATVGLGVWSNGERRAFAATLTEENGRLVSSLSLEESEAALSRLNLSTGLALAVGAVALVMLLTALGLWLLE